MFPKKNLIFTFTKKHDLPLANKLSYIFLYSVSNRIKSCGICQTIKFVIYKLVMDVKIENKIYS